MRLQSLTHIVEAVESLVQPDRITVLGSSALLALYPDLGERGEELEKSLDADLILEPGDEAKVAVADEAVGQDSLFHKEFGCYADFVKSDVLDTFPKGWEGRCLALAGNRRVRCLHPIDVAMIKLALGRPKDLILLKELIRRGVFAISELRSAYQRTPMGEREMFAAGRTLRRLETECGRDTRTSGDVRPVVRETRRTYRVGKKKGKKR